MRTHIYWRRPNKQHLNHRLEWVRKQPEVKEVEPGNILRWEDDGGQIAEAEAATLAGPGSNGQGTIGAAVGKSGS